MSRFLFLLRDGDFLTRERTRLWAGGFLVAFAAAAYAAFQARAPVLARVARERAEKFFATQPTPTKHINLAGI